MRALALPLGSEAAESLEMGEMCELSGVLYTARDAAHKRMIEEAARGEALPIEVAGQVIFYVGPTPPKPGAIIGKNNTGGLV